MNKQKLLELLASWETLKFIIREAESKPEIVHLLMDIALNSDESQSWRAAWIADKIHDTNPQLIRPWMEEMILKLKKEGQSGKKRHFLKLISLNEIPQKYYAFLVNYCLNVLTSAKEPPAVRVHSMQVLFNISEKEPDLKPELLSVIRHEMEFRSTAGIISRGRKLVKKLERQLQFNTGIL